MLNGYDIFRVFFFSKILLYIYICMYVVIPHYPNTYCNSSAFVYLLDQPKVRYIFWPFINPV